MIMKLGRPLEFDPDESLETAMQLFWSKGYEATSLQDLLNAMALSKSSFYQAFGGKHPLFEQCINRYRDKLATQMLDRLRRAKSGKAFIEESLYSLAEEVRCSEQPRGCLIMNSATEFAQRDPVVAELIAQGTEKFTNVFLAAVKRAQAEGDIPLQKNAHALARYLVSSISGLKTMAKAGTDPTTLEEIVGVVLTALE